MLLLCLSGNLNKFFVYQIIWWNVVRAKFI